MNGFVLKMGEILQNCEEDLSFIFTSLVPDTLSFLNNILFLEEDEKKVAVIDSDSAILELNQRTRASVQSKETAEPLNASSEGSITIILSPRSHPSETYLCTVDPKAEEVTLFSILNNQKFAKDFIKKPLRFPEGMKEKICSNQVLWQIKKNTLLVSHIQRYSNPPKCHFFSLDLQDLKKEEFRYELISRGPLPDGFFMISIERAVNLRPERISSKNLCLIESQYTKKTSMNPHGESRSGNLIAQVRATKTPAEDTRETSDRNQKKPIIPLFWVDVNPKDNKFYKKIKASQDYPDLNLQDTRLASNSLYPPPAPTRFYSQELIGFKRNNMKLISIVVELTNLDLVLLVYDISNRRVLKKHYISVQEILNGLRLVSWLQVKTLGYSDFHLNPYQNTLLFKLTIGAPRFNPRFSTHRVELERLVSKGLDVSEIKETTNCSNSQRNSYLVEISDIFCPKSRSFNLEEWDSER